MRRADRLAKDNAELQNSAPEGYKFYTGYDRLEVDPVDVRVLAQSYLDRNDEDWTWCDPEDVRRLARAVLGE